MQWTGASRSPRFSTLMITSEVGKCWCVWLCMCMVSALRRTGGAGTLYGHIAYLSLIARRPS